MNKTVDTQKIKELISLALKARENAYSPYSSFSVGAALLCSNGEIFCGANCENASYTAGICAERAALFSAISAGKRDFIAIAVTGGASNKPPRDMITPCGICRQALIEHGSKEMLVISAKSPDEYNVFTLDELLPGAFDKESL